MSKKEEKKIKKSKKNAAVEKMKLSAVFRIIKILIIVMLAVLCIIEGYKFGREIFTNEAMEDFPGNNIDVVITEDMTNSEFAELLTQKGLVNSSFIFKIQLKLFTNSDYGLMPGEYTLNTSMKPREIIDFVSGEKVVESTEKEELGLYEEEESK